MAELTVPQLDFAALGDLPKLYRDANQAEQTRLTLANLGKGAVNGQPADLNAAALRLAQLGNIGGANQVATLGKNLAAPETTDTLKNLAAENKVRTAKGLQPLSPLDYATQLEKAKATIAHVNTTVNAGVNPILKGIGDRFNDSVESAKSAGDQINSIYEARHALDQGAFTGFGADQKLWMSKAAGLFGLTQDQATNTEVLRSAIGNQVLAKAKTLGANPSNADRSYIEAVTGGKIDLNESTLRRILDMQERWARESITRSNKTASNIMKAYPKELGQFGGLLNTDEPQAYNDWVKSRAAPASQVQPGRTGTGVNWRVVQ